MEIKEKKFFSRLDNLFIIALSIHFFTGIASLYVVSSGVLAGKLPDTESYKIYVLLAGAFSILFLRGMYSRYSKRAKADNNNDFREALFSQVIRLRLLILLLVNLFNGFIFISTGDYLFIIVFAIFILLNIAYRPGVYIFERDFS